MLYDMKQLALCSVMIEEVGSAFATAPDVRSHEECFCCAVRVSVSASKVLRLELVQATSTDCSHSLTSSNRLT